jgi:hypothetical protein
LGVGNLFIGNGQRNPDQVRGLWGVIMAALTLMKLMTR